MRVLFLPHAVLAAGRSAGKCSPVLCGEGQGQILNMGLCRTRLTGMQNLPVRRARLKVGLADNTCSHTLSPYAVPAARDFFPHYPINIYVGGMGAVPPWL